ncbi:hypothetical protein TPHA_0A05720 [Tetrapisispora phaffii CBS 4417]|uniref:SH3 domain-containing protein n=1 Tax=Tetrapisispora phaffii (strain ATCC 24235 / CBS 4417 / NBRC 1672 / NRRL Y-8282 / UCD 70-5) TaxID=1071381 RepID=G8BP18_TETPH|nr:hypothetical protein TPHA_0A05720 [Tetrapisispora phaffii CBS 4417]CCE61646.1 hypothetical protein TPHA_0A05720 [Tetrapisispora phaffii CBS 4417]
MSTSLINRSLTTIRTELEFLKESKVISDSVFKEINSSLPERYDPSNAPSMLSATTTRDSTALEYVEAIYRFDPQQDGDLAIQPGDKIQVLEKISPEWYKGSCNGKVGVFPSNYTKPAFSGSTNASKSELTPVPPQYQQQQQPIQQVQSYHSYQQPFPPQSTNYYQQAPQQQQQQQQPEQQQQQHHSNTGKHLKSFGSKLGNAAIFGAGATIGSDIVNSIF